MTSSRSETPRKKRCRLRVVKKEEEAGDDAKVKKGIIEISTKTNEDVTLKMEEGKLSRRIEPESNQSKLSVTETKISNGKSTINDENTGHKVETKLSSKDKIKNWKSEENYCEFNLQNAYTLKILKESVTENNIFQGNLPIFGRNSPLGHLNYVKRLPQLFLRNIYPCNCW